MEEDAPKLIVCGTGPMEDWCKTFIKENSVNIEMHGFVTNDKTLKIIANSKALVLPTQWYEGFPMSIVEAFSVGTPVVCSEFGNAGSINIEGITGYKFKVDDIQDSISKVEKDKDLFSKTFKYYLKMYTEETNYQILQAVYKRVSL